MAAHSDVSDKKFKQAKPVNLISRSGLILINNLLLVAAACIVLIAILYPLALELLHQPSISVGPHYFNSTFLPMTALLPFLAAIAPLVAWDSIPRAQLRSAVRALAPAMLVAIFIALALISPPSAIAALSLALGGTLLLGTYHYLARMRAAQVKLFSDIGLRHLASAFAHAGLALFVLGMGITATFKHTYELPLDARAPMQMGAYSLRLITADRREENNYIARRVTLRIEHDGHFVTDLTPELRYYPVRNMQTAQAALYSTPLRDIYVVLGESNYSADGKQASLGLRMYVTPGQQLLWAGFLLAGLGGFIGLCSALRRREDL